MPRSNVFKIGVALAAAGVGAVLAITSVFAHSTTPADGGHSIVGSIVKAEVAASFPLVTFDSAPNTVTNEQAKDAEEAAELAAQIAAEQAELAAKQAAAAAAATAAGPCVAADQTEDAAEKAADMTEDAAEKANGTESATEDATEKTARKATDGPEDASEVKCAGTSPKTLAASFGGRHAEGSSHHGEHG
jgi:hypothetical protein